MAGPQLPEVRDRRVCRDADIGLLSDLPLVVPFDGQRYAGGFAQCITAGDQRAIFIAPAVVMRERHIDGDITPPIWKRIGVDGAVIVLVHNQLGAGDQPQASPQRFDVDAVMRAAIDRRELHNDLATPCRDVQPLPETRQISAPVSALYISEASPRQIERPQGNAPLHQLGPGRIQEFSKTVHAKRYPSAREDVQQFSRHVEETAMSSDDKAMPKVSDFDPVDGLMPASLRPLFIKVAPAPRVHDPRPPRRSEPPMILQAAGALALLALPFALAIFTAPVTS